MLGLFKNLFPSSFYMYAAVVVFVGIDILGYRLLLSSLKQHNEKDIKLLFYQIETASNALLTKIYTQFLAEQEALKQVALEAESTLAAHELSSLEAICEGINANHPKRPYHLHLTDNLLTIATTTDPKYLHHSIQNYQWKSLDFNQQASIEVTAPAYLFSHFVSFADVPLQDNSGRVLRVGYVYDIAEKLSTLKEVLDDNPRIEKYLANFINAQGHAGKIYLARTPYSPLEESDLLYQQIEKNYFSFTASGGQTLFLDIQEKEGTRSFVAGKNDLFDSIRMVYAISLNNDHYNNSVQFLNASMLFVGILGIFGIFLSRNFSTKEKLLKFKNKFIAHSVHEIKTPLSIIALNNQLRVKAFGEDTYSVQIDGAIKTLKNSYEDMSFLLIKDRMVYSNVTLCVDTFTKERIKYFDTVARAQGRFIAYISHGVPIEVEMSEVELMRIIDNTLSNAIKYSHIHSTIQVLRQDNTLSVLSLGNPIRDTQAVFKKFSRENTSIGGHGLGLSIVYDICQKYDIAIALEVTSTTNAFLYTFNGTKIAHT
ncbi:MAG: HAMP domain-containing histidine kinase [Campylobacterales bacterium]|nr:HAMP domain-containing histidine kinase [Campylobacterales bacterium]